MSREVGKGKGGIGKGREGCEGEGGGDGGREQKGERW